MIEPAATYRDPLRIVRLVMAGMLLLAGHLGCAKDDASQPRMPEKLAQATEEATSGKTFMESSLAESRLSAEEVEAAKRYISTHPDVSSHILLMTIRKEAPGSYADIPDATKAKVLCDALAKLTFLNDFGILGTSGSYDDGAAKALLEVGKPSLPSLRRLLNNKHEAPLCGSEEATISNVYKYRRADFAYRYAMLILGRKPTFPPEPQQRDKLIADLQKELGSD